MGQCGAVDIVHEIEKGVRVNPVLAHQPVQRRAVDLVIVFLDGAGGEPIHTQEVGDIGCDLLVDLWPEVGMGRIECIIEIEDPGFHRREATQQRAIGKRLRARRGLNSHGGIRKNRIDRVGNLTRISTACRGLARSFHSEVRLIMAAESVPSSR
jgi:hypothetical protein